MLTWMLHHWLLLTIIIISIVVILGGLEALDAWLEFRKAPKEPMFWCHKHGYFRKVHTLPLFPELGGTAENSHVCPTCYYEAVWKNPNIKLDEVRH